ncbi:MAG: Rieske 2Fe-2S domain-containing protein [Thermoplasmata archaeon]|nr:Rieske 2Fe-2S domain-containing protein [Thermoplasmata archaeon]
MTELAGGLPRSVDCATCPAIGPGFYRLAQEGSGRFAPGVLRRIDATPVPSPEEVDEAKRSTLKLALIGGVLALGGAGVASFLRFAVPPPAGAASYPKVQLLYDDGTPVLASKYRHPSTSTDLIVFNYPLDNEPNLLLNLPSAAPGGVGPSQSLIAFSAVCQHLGCAPPFISYYPPGACGSFNGGQAFIHCVCHGSTFNPAVQAPGGGAAILTGPTQAPLPQVLLFWDPSTDELFAVGATGPAVKGHSSTLVGGNVVASPVQTQAPQSPTQQCPV